MTQRQEFRLLEKYKDFELREYLPCVLAEVRVSADYSSASSAAFSYLFKYISKGNRAQEAIAMTAPVIAAQRGDQASDNEWFVSFVMPSGSRFGYLPQPNDPQVILRELYTEVCVAKSFSGRATDQLSKKKINELRVAAGKANLKLSDETRICRFDAPFKPGFLHYNEIVIPIKMAD